MVHDGHGHPAGQRPGFLYSDANEQAERARADAYAEYDEDISERWRQDRANRRQAQRLTAQPVPQTFASPEAAVAAAYAEYRQDN